MPAVRCFSCGKPIGDKVEAFDKLVNANGGKDNNKTAEQVMDELGVDRFCCRRMVLGYTNLIDEILPYPRF